MNVIKKWNEMIRFSKTISFGVECDAEHPCQGLGEHAHFANFGMAFLTLFRVATGDNWNGIMKDTLRTNCETSPDCIKNCCVSRIIAPIFFIIFVLMAQFVLVNVVVAVLMKHLEESHKQVCAPTFLIHIIRSKILVHKWCHEAVNYSWMLLIGLTLTILWSDISQGNVSQRQNNNESNKMNVSCAW